MGTVEVKLLGGFAVVADGDPVEDPWRLRKARTLVKLLALAPDHRIHRDVVIDRLWPDADADAGCEQPPPGPARRSAGPRQRADRVARRDGRPRTG